MATPLERFQELKKGAAAGAMEILLEEFGPAFTLAKTFFKDLDFAATKAKILSEEANKFRIKAFSKDFLFGKTPFKNESVTIEAEIELVNNKLEILAICKQEKSPDRLSKLPGVIGDVLKPLDFINISDLAYIVSTRDTQLVKSAEFPLYNEKITGLKAGISLAGFVDLKSSGKVVSLVTKPLKPLMGEGPYLMLWNLKEKLNIDFSLELPKDISIENVFSVKKPRVVLKPVLPASISIDGLFDVKLPAVPQIAIPGGFAFTADGIRGKFNFDNIADKIPAPFGYPGVHLSTLTITAGISNGIPIAGAEGNFYIGPKKPDVGNNKPVSEFGGIRSNEYKFLYDIIPGKIIPRFAFMYLDKLTIEEYIKALTNKNITLPAFLNKIAMEQLMFHWCETPQGELKPDGTTAMPLFGVSGVLNLFGHRTFGELLADAAGNSKGKLVADPINIGNGLLVIGGSGQGSPATYKGMAKVKPGGMEFAFSSDGQPHFFSFSAKVTLLGISGQAAGSLNNDGITANIQSNIAGIIRDKLEFVFAGNQFRATTTIGARVNGLKISLGKLGTVNLSTTLEGGFNAAFTNDNFSSSMRLRFKFAGMEFDLGELNISVKDLKNIVRDLEEFIRKEVVQKLTKEVLKWLKAAIEGAIEFAGEKLEQIGKALKEEFKETLENAARLMKQAGYKVKEAGEALVKGYKAAEQEVTNALKKAGALAEEAGEVLKDVLKKGGEAAAKVLQQAGYDVEEIGRTLKNVYGLGHEKVGEILKSIGAAAEDVAKVMKDVFLLGGPQIGGVLKLLGFSADAASAALRKIGVSVEDVNNILLNVYKVQAEAARKILETVGFPVKEILDRLPHIKIPLPHIKVSLPHVKAPHLKHIKLF
ncbi:MAG: apolipoprotein A1/A4/E family protein [Chitinophagaceae bacterium]|nr:apolipoprotein A1/A4/E family protein [Chitinophagaceae bacterium]